MHAIVSCWVLQLRARLTLACSAHPVVHPHPDHPPPPQCLAATNPPLPTASTSHCPNPPLPTAPTSGCPTLTTSHCPPSCLAGGREPAPDGHRRDAGGGSAAGARAWDGAGGPQEHIPGGQQGKELQKLLADHLAAFALPAGARAPGCRRPWTAVVTRLHNLSAASCRRPLMQWPQAPLLQQQCAACVARQPCRRPRWPQLPPGTNLPHAPLAPPHPPPPLLQGLVVRDRSDAEHLEDHKLPYAQAGHQVSGRERS